MSQLFLVQFLIQWLCFFSKTSKSQAKKQKVAKKPRGEEDADPYGFESDEEQQDTRGKHGNGNWDFVFFVCFCFVPFFFFLSFVRLTFVFIFFLFFFPSKSFNKHDRVTFSFKSRF